MNAAFENTVSETRRSVLAKLAAAVSVPLLPNVTSAAGDDLHDRAARAARALTNGQDITLKVLAPTGAHGNLNPVIAAFTKMAGIRITMIETQADDISTELLLDALAKSQRFDVALPATFGLPDLVSSGAIVPITEYAQKYEPAGFREDILFNVGDSFDGETYGFQADGDAYMMFFNKSMLQDPSAEDRYARRYGTPLARPNTWSELERQMAFFHDPEKGQYGGLLFRTPSYLAWEWWVRFHAKGVWPFSVDMEPQIASDAGVAALEDMIRTSQYLAPDVESLGLFENFERFSQGDIYCNIGWGGTQKYLNLRGSKMRDNLVFGPTPGGIVNGKLMFAPYFNWGWNYVVSSASVVPEISYLFTLFASSPVMSTLAVRQRDGFFDPYRPEHYDDAGIQDAYSTAFLKVHRASLEGAIPDLYLKDQGKYFRTLGEWLTRALSGRIGPKQALERVRIEWQLITNGTNRDVQTARWNQLRSKYPQHLREGLRDIG